MNNPINPLDEFLIFDDKDEKPTDWDGYEEEKQEVEQWELQDTLKYFDKSFYEFSPYIEKLADLDFMCDAINHCNSFQSFGMSCRCMRENFSNPEEQIYFANKYLELTKQELINNLKEYNNEKTNKG